MSLPHGATNAETSHNADPSYEDPTIKPLDDVLPSTDQADVNPPTPDQGAAEEHAEREKETEEPPFPIEMLPERIAAPVKEFARYASMSQASTFLAVATMLSGAVGRDLLIQTGADRYCHLNIFTLVFSPTGNGKSLYLERAEVPLKQKAKEIAESHEDHIEDIDFQLEGLEDQIEEAVKLMSDGPTHEKGKALFKQLKKRKRDLIASKDEKIYWVEDYSIQELGKLLRKSDEQLVSVSDEAVDCILNLLGANNKNGKPEDSIYNKAYSGRGGRVDRISRDPVLLHNPWMAIHWVTQPEKIPMLYNSKSIDGCGFLERCIAYHDTSKPKFLGWNGLQVNQDIAAKYDHLWRSLFDFFRKGEGGERTIMTSAEAADFMMYRTKDNIERRADGDLQPISGFAARWVENGWRLAGILHVAEHGVNAHQHELSLSTAQAAMCIMDWFCLHQQQLLKQRQQDKMNDRTTKFIKIIRERKGLTLKQLDNDYRFSYDESKQIVADNPLALAITYRSGRSPFVFPFELDGKFKEE